MASYTGWQILCNKNDSSIIAFRMPAAEGFINYQIAAAHSDSPSFKVKENPELTPDKNYVSLNVENTAACLWHRGLTGLFQLQEGQ